MDFKKSIDRRMRIMLVSVGFLFGGIFLYKGVGNLMMVHMMSANHAASISVSAMKAGYSFWQPQLNASGSLRAVRGINVTTEVPGMVREIYFTPGDTVKQDAVLVQLNSDSDKALLRSLEASTELAKITYARDKAQYAVRAVSKQTLDTDAANLKNLQAQVEQQAATLLKKTIRAPFEGRLGISAINLGQYLNPGDTIVSLQTLDPIYVDFYLPQQALAELKVGQAVSVTTDTFPGKRFIGKVTTLNSAVEVSTRNIMVEATIANHQSELTPGMFVNVSVLTGAPQKRLTLPQAAISFNPYGELVYVIKKTGEKRGEALLTVKQRFITTGDSRGDQVAVLTGLAEGEVVVVSGQLKLKNGSLININNEVLPANHANPSLLDEH